VTEPREATIWVEVLEVTVRFVPSRETCSLFLAGKLAPLMVRVSVLGLTVALSITGRI
jgi:hypothetical protein